MKADDLRIIINQNPELLRFKRQLIGCCRRRAPDANIIRRVVSFVRMYPQYRDLLTSIME